MPDDRPMPRAETQARLDALSERVTRLEDAPGVNPWAYLVGAASLFAAIAAVVIGFTR